ncbi:unnamed protein product [Staurois parvus]|uniref:Uncharacterized protein n=1 Tax=Staurois parvus TaxID=386267 RepID=A0ABN9FMD8_9NEOB|nr:unnamed protein product [Staurois parvus]
MEEKNVFFFVTWLTSMTKPRGQGETFWGGVWTKGSQAEAAITSQMEEKCIFLSHVAYLHD